MYYIMKKGKSERMKESVKAKYEAVGINTDIYNRLNECLEHHPKTEALFAGVSEVDEINEIGNDSFPYGDDESDLQLLMYKMDIYFEYKDKVLQYYAN